MMSSDLTLICTQVPNSSTMLFHQDFSDIFSNQCDYLLRHLMLHFRLCKRHLGRCKCRKKFSRKWGTAKWAFPMRIRIIAFPFFFLNQVLLSRLARRRLNFAISLLLENLFILNVGHEEFTLGIQLETLINFKVED
jgi:hypothetical protein